jgi:hypothetical protein
MNRLGGLDGSPRKRIGDASTDVSAKGPGGVGLNGDHYRVTRFGEAVMQPPRKVVDGNFLLLSAAFHRRVTRALR